MDRQTIEAAERVTAWSRARALSAVLAAPEMASAHAEQQPQPLHERRTASSPYLGDALDDAAGADSHADPHAD